MGRRDMMANPDPQSNTEKMSLRGGGGRGGVAARLVFILLMATFSVPAMAVSDPTETAALLAFKSAQIDPGGKLSAWNGNDPCGPPAWAGIYCEVDTTTKVSHVIEIRAMNYNLRGTLVPHLGNLTRLLRLNVINNGLTGQIPPALGKLGNLILFLVNNNELTGEIPPELGNLTSLIRFQIDVNRLSGSIPPQLGNLTRVNHLHMNNNSLSGAIPADLARLRNLNHLILDHNKVSGPLPEVLSTVPQLTIIQLDYNPINAGLPLSWTQIPSLIKLSLRNCSITGTAPELGAMSNLTFVDMSDNGLTGGLPSNISSKMITLAFSNNQLVGNVPPQYATLDAIQNLDLSNNKLNGSVPTFGTGASFNNDSQMVVIDLQNNLFTGWNVQTQEAVTRPNKKVWLTGNPSMCGSNGIIPAPTQLSVCQGSNSVLQQGVSYGSDAPKGTAVCPSSCEYPALLVEANNLTCWCATPITVQIRLKSPSFTYFDPGYLTYFQGLAARALSISTYQVRASNTTRTPGLFSQDITLLIFPPAKSASFNESAYDAVYLQFASWRVSAGEEWSFSIVGPYDFLDFFIATAGSSKKGLSTGAVVGIVVGAVALAAALAALFTFALLRRRSAYSRDPKQALPLLPPGVNIKGVKGFTFAELAKATDNFSSDHELGQGGYGKVYKGVLADGGLVAIKRAQEGSMQGATQFYTEIELLSRVHHRNLVQLLGFCNDRGEQMLVYEFMAGGTLRDHLTPTEIMDFGRRMHIALGTARGILYLHTEADPPIFHRDIKASNILLDERYNAKVADFGLSKLAPIPDLNGATPEHVSTIVKGTPGYLDPEYFLTQKLTDKTDVYSFGVVLLEIITGMFPIAYGKNIVREVNRAMEEGDIMSIADPQMGSNPSKQGLEPLLKLALACCQNESEARPSMVEIVRELEDIWRIIKPTLMSKVDSDTFSIDMEHLRGSHGQMQPSSSSFQDASYIMSDGKGDLRGSINPR
ncbi:hypothetical protein KC19_3G043100 [Ceratodon purpureus]|uniref:non-specific serine/threonine protein kinase n=1 Tax=Ceratodon purpureus TaxID=3225 RepID=A0A8T0IEN3_CERPU|nr:hypothetical protein KC19_3G043100 [Ceratodon purpureus]